MLIPSALHNFDPLIILCHASVGLSDDLQRIVLVQSQGGQIVVQSIPMA
jgi:hypothetical protein